MPLYDQVDARLHNHSWLSSMLAGPQVVFTGLALLLRNTDCWPRISFWCCNKPFPFLFLSLFAINRAKSGCFLSFDFPQSLKILELLAVFDVQVAGWIETELLSLAKLSDPRGTVCLHWEFASYWVFSASSFSGNMESNTRNVRCGSAVRLARSGENTEMESQYIAFVSTQDWFRIKMNG